MLRAMVIPMAAWVKRVATPLQVVMTLVLYAQISVAAGVAAAPGVYGALWLHERVTAGGTSPWLSVLLACVLGFGAYFAYAMTVHRAQGRNWQHVIINAQEASDNLRAATAVAMVGTALAVPNGSGAWETRPERIVLELLTIELNNGLTSGLKRLTDRERPDGVGDDSFPSGHSSQAFVQTELACLNINGMRGLSEGWKIALKTSFRAMAWGTAWARVEGGRHYPSDVLFGAALGNFVAIFVHNAFLPADSRTRVTAVISRREVSFSVALSF